MTLIQLPYGYHVRARKPGRRKPADYLVVDHLEVEIAHIGSDETTSGLVFRNRSGTTELKAFQGNLLLQVGARQDTRAFEPETGLTPARFNVVLRELADSHLLDRLPNYPFNFDADRGVPASHRVAVDERFQEVEVFDREVSRNAAAHRAGRLLFVDGILHALWKPPVWSAERQPQLVMPGSLGGRSTFAGEGGGPLFALDALEAARQYNRVFHDNETEPRHRVEEIGDLDLVFDEEAEFCRHLVRTLQSLPGLGSDLVAVNDIDALLAAVERMTPENDRQERLLASVRDEARWYRDSRMPAADQSFPGDDSHGRVSLEVEPAGDVGGIYMLPFTFTVEGIEPRKQRARKFHLIDTFPADIPAVRAQDLPLAFEHNTIGPVTRILAHEGRPVAAVRRADGAPMKKEDLEQEVAGGISSPWPRGVADLVPPRERLIVPDELQLRRNLGDDRAEALARAQSYAAHCVFVDGVLHAPAVEPRWVVKIMNGGTLALVDVEYGAGRGESFRIDCFDDAMAFAQHVVGEQGNVRTDDEGTVDHGLVAWTFDDVSASLSALQRDVTEIVRRHPLQGYALGTDFLRALCAVEDIDLVASSGSRDALLGQIEDMAAILKERVPQGGAGLRRELLDRLEPSLWRYHHLDGIHAPIIPDEDIEALSFNP